VSGKVVVEGPPLGAALSPGHPPRSPWDLRCRGVVAHQPPRGARCGSQPTS